MTKDGRFDDETGEPEVIVCLPHGYDETGEPEVIVRLPRGYDPAPELVPRATPMDLGAVTAKADTPYPGQHRRVGPFNGAKPKQLFELPTLLIPGHDIPLVRAGTQPVANQFADEPPTLPTPGHHRPPRAGAQAITDRFMDELSTLPNPGHGRPLPRAGTQPVTDRFMDEQPQCRAGDH